MGTPGLLSYPLATVAPTIGPNGISSPSLNDILQSFKASIEAIYGSDLYLEPDSQDGQFLAILAQAQFDSNMAAVAVYNSFNPQTAVGTGLDGAVKLNGISRQVPSNSTAVLTLVGVYGTIINNGKAADNANNLWDLPASVVIPASGTINMVGVCETAGAVQAAPNTITTIYTKVVGWQTVTNATAATAGLPVESDGELRERQKISTAMNALTTADALVARVSQLPGVGRCQIYVNDTNTTDANGVPGHSFSMVVQGGDPQQIGDTIALTKDVGSGTYGSTTVIATDANGHDMPISFSILQTVPIYVQLQIHQLPDFSDASVQSIINSLVSFVNGLAIGEDVYYNWMLAAAQLCDSTRTSFVVKSLVQGTALTSMAAADIVIAYNQAATLDPANIQISSDNPSRAK